MKRILVVDDHPVVQFAMTNILLSSFPDTKVDCFSSTTEARDHLMSMKSAQNKPELLLAFVGIKLPDVDGLDLIQYLKNRYHIPVIAMSGIDNPEKCRECFEIGAAGFIEKTAKIGIYPAAAHLVLSGGKFFPPNFFNHTTALASPESTNFLTARQKEVLKLVVTGKSNKNIASALGLSEGTVKHHISALLNTYRVASRSQLILASIKPEMKSRTNAA